MHRKLIHSARALGIALGLLTAGLILAVPASAPSGPTADYIATPTTVEVKANANTTKAYSRHRRS